MSNTGARLKPEAVREIAFGSITATYAALGPVAIGPWRYLTLDNGTDADLYFSLDGVKDHYRVRPGVTKIYDLKTNDTFVDVAQQLYIRYKTAPSTGDAFAETAFT